MLLEVIITWLILAQMVFYIKIHLVHLGRTTQILLLVPDYNGSRLIDIYYFGIDECLLKPLARHYLPHSSCFDNIGLATILSCHRFNDQVVNASYMITCGIIAVLWHAANHHKIFP